MKKHIKVYIIIVNYGKPEHSIECLQSVLENNYELFHVVIIDISNINQSIHKINSWINNKNDARFTLLHEEKNRGFAFANNIGIKYAILKYDCDYLWILNNDTIIKNNSLVQLVDFINDKSITKNVGIVGTKIIDHNKRDYIQSVGGVFNYWTKFPRWIGKGEKDIGQFDEAELKIDHLIGASMFLQKSLIHQIGLMCEDYFLYFEDADWCIKSKRAGFQNLVCAKSIVYHKQGVSTGVKYINDTKHLHNKKYFYISLLKFYKKHFKLFLPVAYLILIKQMAGKIYHRNFTEAKLISQVVFNTNSNK